MKSLLCPLCGISSLTLSWVCAAFQGYTLQEFDKVQEGELSQLNREVARREEEEHVTRFSSSLAYNLGLVRGRVQYT